MITKETIAKINDEADIIDVLSDFISLKKAGSNYKANCPFHHEKTPSFVISPAKQIYKCFGCGKAGDSVKFVMEHEHFSYVEALKYLAGKYNIAIEETVQSPEMIEQQSKREGLYVVNEFAKDFFVQQMFEHEDGKAIGLSYFQERGFSEAIIKKFQLGFALSSYSALTDAALEKGHQLEMLQKAGLSSKKENTKLDFFRERVMFPIHGVSGKVLGFGGRILKNNVKAPKYINTPDTDIYDKSKVLYGIYYAKTAIRKEDECFLVEGYTDVISLNQAGIENVVSSSGTSLTRDQVRLIKRYTENITVLYDGDAAGIKAALRGIDIILENGLNVKVVLLPENQDPDSFVREKGLNGFEEFVKTNRKDFILFKLELLLENAQNDPVKKAALVVDILESISKIPDPIKRSIYLKECSNLLGVSEQILLNESNKKRKEILSKQRKDEQRQEDQFAENQTLVNELVQTDQDYIEAGISIEKFERDVIRTLLEYGGKPYTEEQLTAEYILNELEGVPFDNELHKKIVDTAKSLQTPEEKTEISSFFINHTDEEISNLAITLILGNYNKYDTELSEGWAKKKVFTLNKNDIYKDDIATEFYWLKFWRIKLLEIEVLKRIEVADPNEDFTKLLLMKKKVDGEKLKLAKEKNTVLTPR
jgi:DNA primase